MAGDRGLLLYDPVKGRVIYRRLEDVEKIDWQQQYTLSF
jgi:hypothetical protein